MTNDINDRSETDVVDAFLAENPDFAVEEAPAALPAPQAKTPKAATPAPKASKAALRLVAANKEGAARTAARKSGKPALPPLPPAVKPVAAPAPVYSYPAQAAAAALQAQKIACKRHYFAAVDTHTTPDGKARYTGYCVVCGHILTKGAPCNHLAVDGHAPEPASPVAALPFQDRLNTALAAVAALADTAGEARESALKHALSAVRACRK